LRFYGWELRIWPAGVARLMHERLKWDGLKREGLAPGFLSLVHQYVKGRKTGALKHRRSLERQ